MINVHMDISVVVPLFNEEESLPELTSWIDRVMAKHQFSYEKLQNRPAGLPSVRPQNSEYRGEESESRTTDRDLQKQH